VLRLLRTVCGARYLHAEYRDFRKCAAGDEDAVSRGVQVGRVICRPLSISESKSLGMTPSRVSLSVKRRRTQSHPVWAAQERFALRLEIVGELPDEVDGTDFSEGDLSCRRPE